MSIQFTILRDLPESESIKFQILDLHNGDFIFPKDNVSCFKYNYKSNTISTVSSRYLTLDNMVYISSGFYIYIPLGGTSYHIIEELDRLPIMDVPAIIGDNSSTLTVADNGVFIAGGSIGCTPSTFFGYMVVDHYINVDSIVELSPLPFPMLDPNVVSLGSNMVIINPTYDQYNTERLFIYDTISDFWYEGTSLPLPMYNPTMSRLNNDCILITNTMSYDVQVDSGIENSNTWYLYDTSETTLGGKTKGNYYKLHNSLNMKIVKQLYVSENIVLLIGYIPLGGLVVAKLEFK